MKAKANLFRTLLAVLPAVVVAVAVALFGVGLRTAEPQEPQAAATQSSITKIQVQDLGTLGDDYSDIVTTGINDAGQVVGYAHANNGYEHAFLWTGDGDPNTVDMKDLGTLGGGSSYAYDINNSGKVVGRSTGHGFIYDSANGMKDLNNLFAADSDWPYSDWPITSAWAINSHGKIVVAWDYGGFLLTPITTAIPATYEVQFLGTLGLNDYSLVFATDINDSGQVVGTESWDYTEGGFARNWHGFLYDERALPTMRDLGSYVSPTGINNSGKVIAGGSIYDSVTQQWQDLGTIGGCSSGGARGINDSGKVVGVWHTCDGSSRAFLKESGYPMVDLNTLIPADSGWTITSASAINSNGQIAATGHKDGVGTHALLLTPTMGPFPPKITSPQNNSYDTDDGSFSVSGTAPAGSTVELFEGTTSEGITNADSSSGAWSIDLSRVSEGPHTYFAKATDAQGNTSRASDSVTITVDTIAPTISSVSPDNGTTGWVRNPHITASWSEKMDPATLATSTVTLVKDGTTTPISAEVFYDDYYYNQVVLTPSPPDLKPPSNLTATLGGTTRRPQVSLKWTDNSNNEDYFVVERSVDNGKTWKVLTYSLAANTTSYTDKTVLSGGKRYTYRVKVTGSPLDAYTKYTVKIKGGTNGVKDPAGHQLGNGNRASGDYWWTFTTGNLPTTAPVIEIEPLLGSHNV